MPTACSDHRPVTSQRCSSERSARRYAGSTGSSDLAGLALRCDGEQLAGDVHERTRVALGVIAQGGDQLRRHQLDGAGLLQGVYDVLLQLLWAGTFERETHPHAAAEREQFL